MSKDIIEIKSKLVSAVDLDQKKIVKIGDVYEALKTLEAFPMTLDILNSSRIGKIVNDIRHFNEAASDVKSRLKDLIKRWNDKLLPNNKGKKPEKSSKSSTNGCKKHIQVSESVNSLLCVNKTISSKISKSSRSSNSIEIMNGNTNNHPIKYRSDCDQSFEIPTKIGKFDNDIPRSKISISEPSKIVQKENHFDNKSIPNSIAQINSLTSIDKTRKRKHETISNGVVTTPIQKVKSTRELLAEMGDLVGNDTKKKILCNEIIPEDDTPRSCLPESVRPRTKPIKTTKLAQSFDTSHKYTKNSPKVPSIGNDRLQDYQNSPNISTDDRSQSDSKPYQKLSKSSPYIVHRDSPAITTSVDQKLPHSISSDEKVSLKLKIAVKHKKKSKHVDPPITNRMDDLPVLVAIDDDAVAALTFDEYVASGDRGHVPLSESVADRLAHSAWEGYTVVRHPISSALVPVSDMFLVDGLYVLPWTDTVFRSRGHFPDDTKAELARLFDFVTSNAS